MARKILAVDIDDTIASFAEKILVFHNSLYGTNHTKRDIEDYALNIVWKCSTEECLRRILLFYQSEHFKDILPEQDVQKVLASFTSTYRIYAITSRPKSIASKTKEWIEKYFPNIFTSIYYSQHSHTNYGDKVKSKAEICDKLHVNIFIDDSLVYTTSCVKKDRKVFLYNQPWNQQKSSSDIIRVHSWKEIQTILLNA